MLMQQRLMLEWAEAAQQHEENNHNNQIPKKWLYT